MPGAVGGPYHQDLAVVPFHTVHLSQELVHQRALEVLAHIQSIATQSFDFIEEQHGRPQPASRLEDSVQLVFALTVPHIEYIADAHIDESRPYLSRCRPCYISLAAAWRAKQEQPSTCSLAICSKH